MMSINRQRGVGMIEVLVALVILAIGVLGFSALQLRAMEATAEATNRTMAMNLARDLAERIRINRLGLNDYITAINQKKKETGCLGSDATYVPNCDMTKTANYDANEIITKANEKGQTIIMHPCDGSTLTCIYVAWGNTVISQNNVSGCMSSGTYVPDAKCIVMEAF
jgi:type IV pilus assembly protein PilV